MKTNLIKIFLVAIVAITFGCQKEEALNLARKKPSASNPPAASINNLDKPTVENGILVFRDASHFEATVDELAGFYLPIQFELWESTLNFTSIRKASANGSTTNVFDEVLSSILNDKKLVRVGDNIIMLPSPIDSVLYYLNIDNYTAGVQDLIAGTKTDIVKIAEQNSQIIDDEVLPMALGCGESTRSDGTISHTTSSVYAYSKTGGIKEYRAFIRFYNKKNLGATHAFRFVAGLQYYALEGGWQDVQLGNSLRNPPLDSWHISLEDLFARMKPRCRDQREDYTAYKFMSGTEYNYNKLFYYSGRGLNKIYGQCWLQLRIGNQYSDRGFKDYCRDC